jgi:hypothetical protein
VKKQLLKLQFAKVRKEALFNCCGRLMRFVDQRTQRMFFIDPFKQARLLKEMDPSAQMLLYRSLSRVCLSAQLNGLCAFDNFDANLKRAERAMDRAVESLKLLDGVSVEDAKWILDMPNQDLVNYISRLLPVHRCSAHVFEAIVNSGFLSLERLYERCNLNIDLHHRIYAILFSISDFYFRIRSLGKTIRNNLLDALTNYIEAHLSENGIETAKKNFKDKVKMNDEEANYFLQVGDLVVGIIQNPPKKIGCECSDDKKVDTHKHVFASLGPNHCAHYGNIAIAFKEELMRHPDFFLTMQAAFFYVGHKGFWTYSHRPWAVLALDETSETCKVNDLLSGAPIISVSLSKRIYKLTRLNAVSGLLFYQHIARDLQAQARLYLTGRRPPRKEGIARDIRSDPLKVTIPLSKEAITSRTVMDYHWNREQHALPECHLPEYIPLDLIEKIWMTKEAETGLHDLLQKTVLRDGRCLADIVQVVKNESDLIKQQHLYFEQDRHVPLRSEFASFSVCNLKGTAAFLPLQVSQNSEFTFVCEAYATNDVRIILCSDAELYETHIAKHHEDPHKTWLKHNVCHITFGCQDNKYSKISCGTDTLIKSDRKSDLVSVHGQHEYRTAALDFYWVTYNPSTGWITAGKGTPPSLLIPEKYGLRTKLPSPIQVKHIGVSCWRQPIEYRRIYLQLGGPAEAKLQKNSTSKNLFWWS